MNLLPMYRIEHDNLLIQIPSINYHLIYCKYFVSYLTTYSYSIKSILQIDSKAHQLNHGDFAALYFHHKSGKLSLITTGRLRASL